MTNEERAKVIAENASPYDVNKDNCEYYDCYRAAMQMAQWKDEQHEKEKQVLIQEYEDKLNKLNQREETIRDNIRRANSRYGFEGLF